MRAKPMAPPPMASSGMAGSGEPDMVLISELLEEISRHPPAIAARKLLLEHYVAVGWLDAASDLLTELKRLAPGDSELTNMASILQKPSEPPAQQSASKSTSAESQTDRNLASKPAKRRGTRPLPKLDGNIATARSDLIEGYQSLRVKAKFLLTDLLHLQSLQKKNGLLHLQSKNTARVQTIAERGSAGKSDQDGPPGSIRSVARTMESDREKATEIAITDLEDMIRWIREPHGKPSGASDDTIRDALVKRIRALESALPEDLKIHCDLGLMHVVHENLEKTYANDETMLGDSVKDIPRENLYVTEDNYAWDMEELVQAITANSGVMRNPLSRQMFTPKDIKGILAHKHGKQLAALQVQQHEMSKGVRPETITKMEALSKTLLEDQSSDQLPSRHAVDEFVAYLATLPELEQKAIDGLRCPAKDSHTGQAYDFSIGEAVRDAKGNRVCFHKTGDFIKQAAAYLRQNRGAPPDPDKCLVM